MFRAGPYQWSSIRNSTLPDNVNRKPWATGKLKGKKNQNLDRYVVKYYKMHPQTFTGMIHVNIDIRMLLLKRQYLISARQIHTYLRFSSLKGRWHRIPVYNSVNIN